MKTKLLSLFCLVIISIAMVEPISAQITSITIKWNDECLPAMSPTDYYKVSLSILRISNQVNICDTPVGSPNLTASQYSEYPFNFNNCYCQDSYQGYRVTATVSRYDHLDNFICTGTTEFDISCEGLYDITEIKVDMPN